MKKGICILLMVLMTVSVCACAGAKEPNVEQNSSAVAENDVSGVSSSVSDAKTESKEIAVSDESRESSETDAASDATSDLLSGHIIELPDDLFEGGQPIGVNGDWIYYDNGAGRLAGRVKIDGSDRLRYENDGACCAYVEGDRIYYVDDNDNRHLYAMEHDGTGVTLLCADKTDGPLAVSGDRLYYRLMGTYDPDDWSGRDRSSPYSIKTDGTDKRKLGGVGILQALPQTDGWIYTREGGEYDGGRIYKIRPDGSEKTYLTDVEVIEVEVHDGWIYYTLFDEDGLFKMRTDGTEKQMLCDEVYRYMSCIAFDETSVYTKLQGALYAINKDGTDKRKLSDYDPTTTLYDRNLDFFAQKDTLYFCTIIDNETMLYAVETDGTNERCIVKDDVSIILRIDSGFFYRSNGTIYFYSYEKVEK